MSEVFIKSFTHLKDRPKADEALRQLQRIASFVKPIMRKHGWVLPVLAEFFPESPNLLGTFLKRAWERPVTDDMAQDSVRMLTLFY